MSFILQSSFESFFVSIYMQAILMCI